MLPLIILLCSIVVIIWLKIASDPEWIRNIISSANREKLEVGDWGDSFGGIDSLFTAITLIGVILTIWMQFESNKKQANSLGKGEFERMYFQLISLIREQRSELKFDPNIVNPRFIGPQQVNKITSGIEAIETAHSAILNKLSELGPITSQRRELMFLSAVNKAMQERHEAEFSPYFRTIYTILSRIDKNPYLSDEERREFSRLLRSQLNSYEVLLIGLNGLLPESKDLKKYLVKYRMLKYAQKGPIKRFLEKKYPPETFTGRA